jgi:predicted nucleic acid-binding protein
VHFLDCNILLYSISGDAAEAAQRERAIELMDRTGGALSAQVLGEFYAEATRPSRPDRLGHKTAMALVAAWMLRLKVQPVTMSILAGAMEIAGAHGLPYWDSAIIAAARALGCTELFSADLPHGREIDRVRIVDPFR